MKTNVWVVHIQSESSENYYAAFNHEPSDDDVLNFQKEKYKYEFQQEPGEYFRDLMGLRNIIEVEVKGDA